MTAPRPRRKVFPLLMRFAAAALLNGLPLSIGVIAAEYIVVNHHTGLAISGFDPVAYSTEDTPTLGRGEFEHIWEGTVWRFRNAGNREAFASHPEIYAPRFGGYDPVGIARGVAVPGDPQISLITGGRLYLFYTREARDTFIQHSEGITVTADGNWSSVQLTLSP